MYFDHVTTFPRLCSFSSYDETWLICHSNQYSLHQSTRSSSGSLRPEQIQWTYPEQFECDKMFIKFGGLHIEMAALKAIGHCLDGSGWCGALVQARVTTEGVAESLLSATHVKRARYSHQLLQQHFLYC